MFNDFIDMVFPQNCFACETTLEKHEECICLHCHYQLPKTNLHNTPTINELHYRFAGKVPLTYAFAYLSFTKKGRVQKLLHALKYKSQERLGEKLGYWYGMDLLEKNNMSFDDYIIIPVPLHLRKLKERGYNQSEAFSKGLSDSLKIPLFSTIIQKTHHTSSQTNKSRLERWKNVENVFYITNTGTIQNKKVLLVDDVITTGSTLEACALALQKSKVHEISIAGLALAC